ncbi:hypothetical protein [Pseudomonas chlororaphis]|uniref:hypothetical protein n=1 Tax=Pseudomonas chlororaphis TaxID=587753 RepID=UPI001927FE48|nr:hypothetical protein [Pseudomonas chlororaphis]QQX57448.1 hypothetical protein JHW28_23155 [Pseudomonas chlororaphis subsp. aurantiaca]
MDNEEMAREIAKSAHAFADPIDFEKLVKDGLLIKKGKSFYAPDLEALPEVVSRRIKEVVSTKNGLRVTFYKESKSLKKLAGKLSHYLE